MKSQCEPIPNQMRAQEVNTYLDHFSALDIDSKPQSVRLTEIVCTIGDYNKH